MKKSQYQFLIALIALLAGVGGTYAVLARSAGEVKTVPPQKAQFLTAQQSRIVPGKFTPVSFKPPKTGKMIGVDLLNNEVTLFTDARVVRTVHLLAVAAPGSIWETPPGVYKVLTKKKNHFSPITKATFPWAVHFYGNSFLHGDPVVTGVLGKGKSSLHLGNIDAEAVSTFAEVGIPVTVLGKESGARLVLATMGDTRLHFENSKVKPVLSARSYVVQDLDTGEKLLEKNATLVLPIASVSKLMTTLVAEEVLATTTEVTVSRRAAATPGAAGGIRAGEKFTIGEVYYPLLLESSNQAAEILAEAGERGSFLAKMNMRADTLGMTKTHFDDPSGLDPHNVSTADDLAKLAGYLVKEKPEVLALTRRAGYATANGAHHWVNHNRLVVQKNARYIGGKTGYIDEAGQTSVALFSFPAGEFVEKKVAVIMLRSYNRDADTRAILRYLQGSLFYDTGVPVNDNDLDVARFTKSSATSTPAASLIAVGTIRIDAAELTSRGLSLGKLFASSYYVKSASLALGHLLGPVTTVGYQVTKGPALRTATSTLQVLAETGFDAFLVANNHAGDWGRSGLAQTGRELEALGLDPLGIGEDGVAAKRLRIREVQGVKLGLLGMTTDSPEWLRENDNLPVVLSTRDPELLQVVRAAAAHVDHLVVAVSFGESVTEVTPAMKALTHNLIDAGAHAVFGYGPHAVSPIEKYNDGIIVYSLGDFLTISRETNGEAPSRGLALELIFDTKKIIAVNAEHVTMNEHFEPLLIDAEE